MLKNEHMGPCMWINNPCKFQGNASKVKGDNNVRSKHTYVHTDGWTESKISPLPPLQAGGEKYNTINSHYRW